VLYDNSVLQHRENSVVAQQASSDEVSVLQLRLMTVIAERDDARMAEANALQQYKDYEKRSSAELQEIARSRDAELAKASKQAKAEAAKQSSEVAGLQTQIQNLQKSMDDGWVLT